MLIEESFLHGRRDATESQPDRAQARRRASSRFFASTVDESLPRSFPQVHMPWEGPLSVCDPAPTSGLSSPARVPLRRCAWPGAKRAPLARAIQEVATERVFPADRIHIG